MRDNARKMTVESYLKSKGAMNISLERLIIIREQMKMKYINEIKIKG